MEKTVGLKKHYAAEHNRKVKIKININNVKENRNVINFVNPYGKRPSDENKKKNTRPKCA